MIWREFRKSGSARVADLYGRLRGNRKRSSDAKFSSGFQIAADAFTLKEQTSKSIPCERRAGVVEASAAGARICESRYAACRDVRRQSKAIFAVINDLLEGRKPAAGMKVKFGIRSVR